MKLANRNIIFLLILTAFVILVWPSLREMELLWRRSETFMHCYLILPIFGWLLWRRRIQLVNVSTSYSLPAALAATLFMGLWLSAYLIEVNFVSHFSIVSFVIFTVWACYGTAVVSILRFPLIFLYFLVPFGEAINPALQDVTAYLTVILLNISSIPVYREGLYLHTAFGLFEVAVACSGLNFLIASLSLACLYAYITYSKLYKQISFVVLTVVVSIIANSLRAFLLIFVAKVSDFKLGFGTDHYYYGWLVFFLVIYLMFWLGNRFTDPTPSIDLPAIPQEQDKKKSKVINRSTAVILMASLVMALLVRTNLPVTEVQTPGIASGKFQQYQLNEHSDWGITFYDGLTRDLLLIDNNVEFLHASYALRQDKGEMISWHNRLFDRDRWTITGREQLGDDIFKQTEILYLRNTQGHSRAVLYTFHVGDIKTSRPHLAKLAQLYELLRFKTTNSTVTAFSTTGVNDEQARQLLLAVSEDLLVTAAENNRQ